MSVRPPQLNFIELFVNDINHSARIGIYRGISIEEILRMIQQEFRLPADTRIIGVKPIPDHEPGISVNNSNKAIFRSSIIPLSYLAQNPNSLIVQFIHTLHL